MHTNQRTLWAIALLALSTLFFGCASSVGVGDDSSDDGFVSVLISKSSSEAIKLAAISVFTAEGFKLESESAKNIRFSKAGNTATSLLYGTTMTTEGMTIEPVLTIDNLGGGFFKIDCEVQIIEHYGDNQSKKNWELHRNGKRAYQKLLDKTKDQAEGK